MYKMNCYYCDTEMTYIKDNIEELGYVVMKCPNCPEQHNSHLVPKDNPDLIYIKESDLIRINNVKPN